MKEIKTLDSKLLTGSCYKGNVGTEEISEIGGLPGPKGFSKLGVLTGLAAPGLVVPEVSTFVNFDDFCDFCIFLRNLMRFNDLLTTELAFIMIS